MLTALSSLARAAFYAGASALVSHWAIALQQSRLYRDVQDFARQPNDRGEPILDMISAGDAGAHPAYWAPFVVWEKGAARWAASLGLSDYPDVDLLAETANCASAAVSFEIAGALYEARRFCHDEDSFVA
jgi:hypothetical protein